MRQKAPLTSDRRARAASAGRGLEAWQTRDLGSDFRATVGTTMQDSVPAALLQKWKTLTVYCRFFMRTEDTLMPALLGQISNSAADWLQSAQDLAGTGSVQDLLRVYPQASRYLGRQPFVLS